MHVRTKLVLREYNGGNGHNTNGTTSNEYLTLDCNMLNVCIPLTLFCCCQRSFPLVHARTRAAYDIR